MSGYVDDDKASDSQNVRDRILGQTQLQDGHEPKRCHDGN